MRIAAPQDAQDLQAVAAGHLLVEQDEVVQVLAHQLQRIVAIRDGVDVIAPRLQKEQVRLQQVDLVVDPEDALRRSGGLDHPGS